MNTDSYTYTRVCTFIQNKLDFSIHYYNDDYVSRRFRARMRRTSSENLEEYFRLLQESTDEQERLIESFSINVTGFFRDKPVWNHIQKILRKKTDDELCRVWSAGCADGREPYSLSLLAHSDPQIEEENLQIHATDINTEALERAEEAQYRQRITSDTKEQLQFLDNVSQFTTSKENYVQIDDRVTDQVQFFERDLIREDPIDTYDLVLCRNVLIYVKRKHEVEIFQTIQNALNDTGFLVIGMAETLPEEMERQFNIINSDKRIYYFSESKSK